MYVAITYIGRNPGFRAKVGSKIYEFEWQKSLGIGTKQDEINPRHAEVLSKWKDRGGRKMFILE